MTDGIITIKKGREKPIRNQHPWIFSGAIADAKNANAGDIVTVVDHKGNFLARGYWNPKSQIQVRLLTWQDELINDQWWHRMLKRSIMARHNDQRLHRGYITGFRVVNAESDFLPGLVVDYYAGYLVLQALTLGIDSRKHNIAQLFKDIYSEIYPELEEDSGIQKFKGVYERSDVDIRKHEGLPDATGTLLSDLPPELVTIQDRSLKYKVDIINGHKTGFYLDQRVNRHILQEFTADDFTPEGGGHRVLNLFSYTGAFGVTSLFAGFGLPGHIINVDASYDALELAEANFKLNFHGQDNRVNYIDHAEFIQADAFDYLHHCVAENEKFDLVILDPPKFAHNKRQVNKASRGYKDLNLNAFKIINEGGYLMTFSCSGAISRDLFQKIVFGALADSGRQAQIITHLSASDDHPIALTFPEGEYLKGLLLRVF